MDILTLLRPGTMLLVNPHRYDYVHHIELARRNALPRNPEIRSTLWMHSRVIVTLDEHNALR
jgi:hypothetical protein